MSYTICYDIYDHQCIEALRVTLTLGQVPTMCIPDRLSKRAQRLVVAVVRAGRQGGDPPPAIVEKHQNAHHRTKRGGLRGLRPLFREDHKHVEADAPVYL